MVALGIGSEIDVHELNSMASEPIDTNVILVHNFSSLADVEIKFHVASCNGLYSSVFSVQSRFGESGGHQPLTLISANRVSAKRVSANREDTSSRFAINLNY